MFILHNGKVDFVLPVIPGIRQLNFALSKWPERRGVVHLKDLICGVILFAYFVPLMELSLSTSHVAPVSIWKLISGPPFNFIVAVIFDGILPCIACTESTSGVN